MAVLALDEECSRAMPQRARFQCGINRKMEGCSEPIKPCARLRGGGRVDEALQDTARTILPSRELRTTRRVKWESANSAIDLLNTKYTGTIVSLGKLDQPKGDQVDGKISYTRIPDAEDFW